MEKRTSAPARIIAALALVGAVILIVVAIGGSTGGESSEQHRSTVRTTKQQRHATKHVPASYTVETGDTLISISYQTGVPVSRILALNPGVDPQILIAGEKLKLR